MVLFVSSAHAGARDGEFSLVNISKQPMNKEGARLYELIQNDLKELYNDDSKGFAWDTEATVIHAIDPALVKGLFSPMIILKDKKALSEKIQKMKAQDGLIVFEYDLVKKQVRLKHFSWDGTENMLIRLPINQGGAMNLSLWKGRRRAALVALGKSFEFNP